MDKMKLEIKQIVRKNLISESRKKEYISESFSKIKNLKGEKLIDAYVGTTFKLMDEGYDFDEIELYLNEQESGILSQFGDILKGGLWSSVKEYAYGWFFTNFLGLSKENAKMLSIGLADTSPLEFLRMFKDESSCQKSAPKIIESILEILVRKTGSGLLSAAGASGVEGVTTTVIGNMVGDSISKSNIGEIIATEHLCKLIHKENTSQNEKK
jgi:hypothetical protein